MGTSPAHERNTQALELTSAKESVVFLAREKAVEGAALADLGLDPRWWVAAVPTELSAAGIVNKNGRIYRTEEFVANHQRLHERATSGYVSGLKGHPMRPELQDGDREFDIAIRLMSVETYVDDMGVLRAKGVVAFPNTTDGKDLYVLWRGGLEIGTSSRARAVFLPHTIDESSPYWAQNPAYRGKTVVEAVRWTLGQEGTYDLVLDPSASTFLDGAAREAVSRYENCELLPKEKDMAEKNDELVAQQAVEAYRATDPFAKLDEDVRADLLAAYERADGKVVDALEALESAKTALETQLAEVTAERDTLVAEKTEAERMAALNGALEAALADYPLAAQVRKVVENEIATFENAEALEARVTYFKDIFDGVAKSAEVTSRTATESVDDESDADNGAGDDPLVGILAGRV